jgi:hypothetical protein
MAATFLRKGEQFPPQSYPNETIDRMWLWTKDNAGHLRRFTHTLRKAAHEIPRSYPK